MAWHRFQNKSSLLLLSALAVVSTPRYATGQSSAKQPTTSQSSIGQSDAIQVPNNGAGAIAAKSGSPQAPTAPKANPADIRRARQEYALGMTAERSGNWNEAFQNFSEAAQASPDDKTIKLQQEFARSALVRDLSSQAEKQLLGGQNDQARATLAAALQLDPSYSVARERLAQITALTSASAEPQTQSPNSSTGGAPSPRTNLGPRLASGPPQLQWRPGLHDFDYRGTTRGAYEEVARQFGVTAAFDTDLPDRSIRFTVPAMDFETALRVLGEQTTTFWRSVDSTTFFVAADTADKRRTYDPVVEEIIPLPNSETNDEMTETSRVVRDIVGLRRTTLNLESHTMTVRDTLENVALAKALVQEIEKPQGEALLDIDILEVDSQLARNIGVTPPSSAKVFTLSSSQVQQLEQSPNIGTLEGILATIFGGSSLASSSGGALIPPLIAFGGGKTVFFATLPGAMAGLSETLSAVKTAQRVLLRIEDGRPATFFVGEHFPVTLALLSESLVTPNTALAEAVSSGTFPVTNFDVGRSPSGVATGDFNGDGTQDLAVVNSADDSVSILLGSGSAQFPTMTTYATGKGPVAITTGDFNGDGKLDLAIVNNCTVNVATGGPCAAGDYSVSILLGNGDGTFSAPVNYPVGTSPVALVSGTFNTKNDQHLDLAVVNQGANTISVLLGKGDGTFGTKQDFPVGSTPTAITTADFNNDGFPDLAVTNRGDNDFSLLLGAGSGTFPTQTTFTTGKGPSAIVSADFNVDGSQDVAVANFTDNTVSIILGNGKGSFGTTNTYASGTGPIALVEADFNQDGAPDLVVANETDDTVTVFLGLGDGTLLSTPLTVPTGNSPVAMAEADLNSDGLPDLAVANQASNTVSVVLNSSSIPTGVNANQTPYPGSQYIDLGLKVHAEPRMHPDNEVTLDLQFDISSLSGQSVNGIPVLTNRSIKQTVRLKEDQTSFLSGIIQSNESKAITGVPGLAEAGPLGYLAAVRSNQNSNTELVIAITPRQLRLAPHVDNSLYAGRGEGPATSAAPPPLPIAAPASPPQPGPPGTAPPISVPTPPQGAPPAAPGTVPLTNAPPAN